MTSSSFLGRHWPAHQFFLFQLFFSGIMEPNISFRKQTHYFYPSAKHKRRRNEGNFSLNSKSKRLLSAHGVEKSQNAVKHASVCGRTAITQLASPSPESPQWLNNIGTEGLSSGGHQAWNQTEHLGHSDFSDGFRCIWDLPAHILHIGATNAMQQTITINRSGTKNTCASLTCRPTKAQQQSIEHSAIFLSMEMLPW